jgi:hypothetical protein
MQTEANPVYLHQTPAPAYRPAPDEPKAMIMLDGSNALYGQMRKPVSSEKSISGEHSLYFFESPLKAQFCKLFGCVTRSQ